MEKKITSHLTKGLILSLILIVVDLVAGFANFRFASWYRWVSTLILAAGIIWACISYGKQMQNQVSYGNVFAHGFKVSAVIACIMVVFTLISIYLIFPETKELVLEQTREAYEKTGKMTQEQMDQGIEIVSKMFLPFAIAGAILGTLIVGVISALVGAALTKREPVTPFDKQV